MPETEKKARAGKREIPIPKPTTGASEDVLRDESSLYGDEAELTPRRRKRTDARVPIMRKPKSEAEPGKEAEPTPVEEPEKDAKKKKKARKADSQLPKIAPSKKKKKPRRRKRRLYRSFVDLMTASGSSGPFRPIRMFGRDIRFWPLIVLVAIAILAGGVMLNNSNLVVTEQIVTVVGLPNDLEGYRIVVLSDMNAKRFGDNQSLLLRTLNGLKYDAIFCVGDMVGKSGNAEPFWEFIEGLRNPDKVYFICGDSDPGPYIKGARSTEGILSQLVLEDWILGATERGAHYVDAPVCIPVKSANLWVSPATMLNLETISTLETWQDQTDQEVDGVRSGITDDYTTLPLTTYRTKLAQALYDAQRQMNVADIHISLAHEPPADAFIYTSEDHDPGSERFLLTPELIVAGHYCGGVWRLPGVGALYVPDSTMERGGWFPDQEDVAGLSTVGETQMYITRGLSTNGSTPLLPFRLFNEPEVSVLTLTSTLPENMLEAAGQ